MTRRPLIVAASLCAVGLVATTQAAEKLDPRLAAVRKAWVVPLDELSDDVKVAACVADRLSRVTPLESVKSRDEADVVLTVAKASVGKHPKADIAAALPDGTKLWDGHSKTRGFNLVGRDMTCPIAEDLLSNLRNAMRKARDGR